MTVRSSSLQQQKTGEMDTYSSSCLPTEKEVKVPHDYVRAGELSIVDCKFWKGHFWAGRLYRKC